MAVQQIFLILYPLKPVVGMHFFSSAALYSSMCLLPPHWEVLTCTECNMQSDPTKGYFRSHPLITPSIKEILKQTWGWKPTDSPASLQTDPHLHLFTARLLRDPICLGFSCQACSCLKAVAQLPCLEVLFPDVQMAECFTRPGNLVTRQLLGQGKHQDAHHSLLCPLSLFRSLCGIYYY